MKWNDFENQLKDFENEAVKEIDAAKNEGLNVYPPVDKNGGKYDMSNIYKALELTPFENVKVVVLGQDPYHEEGQANGLAFSVGEGVTLPPSLRNMYKELQDDIGGELRTTGDLSDWARQGVLLLNTALSVIEGNANSMAEVWEPYTDKLIELIDSNKTPVVFVLWGNNARKKKKLIKNNKDFVIESAHPSPLSAYRGFFGSKPYSKINTLLRENGLEEINWV